MSPVSHQVPNSASVRGSIPPNAAQNHEFRYDVNGFRIEVMHRVYALTADRKLSCGQRSQKRPRVNFICFRTSISAPQLARLCRSIVVLCVLLLPLSASINGQQKPDPSLLEGINKIQAIDNHCHDLPARDPSAQRRQPADPLGKSTPFTAVPFRETNPDWIEAWRGLYGYKYKDRTPEHVVEVLTVKERLIREKGNGYPAWVLDQTRIDVALVNAPLLGSGQGLPRFRWVPFADGFLFPFDSKDPTGNIQRRRKEIGVVKPPTMWNDYLDMIRQQLKQWKA